MSENSGLWPGRHVGTRRGAIALGLAVALVACGEEAPVPAPGVDAAVDAVVAMEDTGDALADSSADAPAPDVSAEPDALPDADPDGGADVLPDVAPDAGEQADIADASDTADAHVPGPPRTWQYRAIGGVSMGAAAAMIALQNPDSFDVVGAMGGYIDLSYLVQAGRRLQLGGFCSLETLKAATDLNDPNEQPPTTCGPVQPTWELEWAQDWNHLHFDDDGATFDREFYVDIFQSFMMAFGNFTTAPGASVYLPGGVDPEWFAATAPADRCASPKPVAWEASFNAEYNPEGLYPVIPFCDSDKQVTPGLAKGEYDPAVQHTRPVDVLLAVDINGNGVRDYAEPVFVNASERWEDIGADGCASPREDGTGGCLPAGAPDVAGDPNGDDFHWWDNPAGAEHNEAWDEGEPFLDDGLDGVSVDASGVADHGEGNGVYDRSVAFDRMRTIDAYTQLWQAPEEALERLDFWFDGGIRDTFHSPVSTRRVVGALHGRGFDIRRYHGFGGTPDAVLPESSEDAFLGDVFVADLSAGAVGKNVYVEYGDPAATPAQIEAGDGKHVGTPSQALNRITGFLAFASKRMPKPDIKKGGALTSNLSHASSFYSEAMKSRRNFVAVLPPGYFDPENATDRYPVVFMLHGHGQRPEDLAPASIALAPFMIDARLPRVMVVVPDGSCCFVDQETGLRECGCRKGPSGTKLCVDPTCKGPHESCEERAIPNGRLVEECHDGSLYFNLLVNRWGEERDDLRYQDQVLELISVIDANFRTRPPETLTE